MDAAEVAGTVVDAIRDDRFWILTHDAYRDVIQARAAGIGTDARPDRRRSGDGAARRQVPASCATTGAIGTTPSLWNRM